ncbi:MAG: 30S ribosomal protein S3 [Clostridiales bacterium]|nr:30S ribosomal protein S3 [Candidatus Crickella caballi]
MGQKVNPHGMRVGINKDWSSKWYADKSNFADFLVEDNQIRVFVKKRLYNAGVSNIVIERPEANKVKVIVMVARPGMVIGKAGEGIEECKKALNKLTGKTVEVSLEEVRRTELDAQLTAESVAQALERRTSFRRAMKQPIQRTMKAGAKGIKIVCSGRLGGAEIARSEKYSEGNVPLHTLRADIDYGFAEADTTYGKIGVKVWINHGEILDKVLKSAVPSSDEGRRDKKSRRNDKKDRRNAGRADRREGRRFDGREAKPEVKPATTRVRKTPKAAPAPVEEAQVEAPAEAAVQETEA